MDEDKAARFISSLVKSLQALCNGFVDFSSSVEVIGHIHLNIDRSVKLDYVLTEEVSKSPSEGATVFASHSYHSQPPSSASSKSGSDTSNHGQKSRKDKEADPLGLSALPREVPNTSKSDSHPHSSNRESSNSSHSFSGNVGFSRDSESDSAKHENSRLSCQFEESANRRRKMGPLSQRTPSPAAKRSRVSDFGPGARTVVKEAGFEVIEIKEEPEEEPSVFFGGSGGMASGQDIQTPDFSNVVMESLERVDKLEKGGDLVGGDGGDVMSGPQQPVFPVMFHPSDGMPSSSAGPIPGPSDSQPVASTSGDVVEPVIEDLKPVVSSSKSAPDLPAVTSTPLAPPTLSIPSVPSTRPTMSILPISPKFKPEDLPPDTKPEDVARLTECHVLERVPPTEKKKYPSKRCKVCLRRSGYTPSPARKHPKESVYYCPQCPSKPGLCCFPCYYVYHSKMNFWELDEAEGEQGTSGSRGGMQFGDDHHGTGSEGYGLGAPGLSGMGGGRDVDYVGHVGRYGSQGHSSQGHNGHGQGPSRGLLIEGVTSLAGHGGGGGGGGGEGVQSDGGAMFTGGVIDVDAEPQEQKFCPVPMYGESLYGPGGHPN